jgi:hypothetical protein
MPPYSYNIDKMIRLGKKQETSYLLLVTQSKHTTIKSGQPTDIVIKLPPSARVF